MLSVKVIRKVQTRWPQVWDGAVDTFLDDVGPFMVGEVKTRTPKDEGILRESITSKRDGNEVRIGTNVEYAAYVEYGTNPHPITVNHVVKLKDGYRYLGTVQHPGTKEQSFLRRGLDENRKRLLLMFRDKLREAFRRGRQS